MSYGPKSRSLSLSDVCMYLLVRITAGAGTKPTKEDYFAQQAWTPDKVPRVHKPV